MKRSFHIFLTCLVLSLFFGQRAAAESPFVVDVWNTDDRLPQSSVVALTQTRDGYLWLGTLNGLARFDGNFITKFNVNNTPGLPSNKINFLFEDTLTNLWVGTDNGALSVIENGALKKIHDGSSTAGKITAGFDDQNGAVWFVTDARQILCWRKGMLELRPVVNPELRNNMTYLAFHVIVQCKDGSIWRLHTGQVEKWRGELRENNFGPVPWGNATVTAVCEDDAGGLVVGTSGAGVFWFNRAGNFSSITQTNGLPSDYVLSLVFDSGNNLWVGTDGKGLARVRKKTFSAPAELSGRVAQSVAEDVAGGMWTAFNLRGLAYWRTNHVEQFSIGANNAAWCVLVDDREQVWAGTSGQGLFRLVNGAFQPVPAAMPVGQKVFCLLKSHDGKVWVGGETGLASFDGERWNYFTTVNGLSKSDINALVEDKNGILWIGTKSEGLFTLQNGAITGVNVPMKDISTLLISADGALWSGSMAHGLARRSTSGEWKLFSSTTNGLANDDINSLAEDDAGNLWIGSYEGLVRVEKDSIANVLAGAVKTLSCRTFLTRECSAGAQPATLRARDGQLWFPTIEGLVSVDPANLKKNSRPPPVIIESVLVDSLELKTNTLASGWNGAVMLTPQNEQLEIRFTALNFSAPKGPQSGVRFKYILEGRDKNPTDLRGERSVILNRLAPGHYIFRVKAGNEDDVWNESGATIAITVEPPFWRKTSFLVSMGLVVLAVLAGIIYLISTAKLKRQLRVARQKELIETERARIARDLHDQLGANITQITLLGEMAEMDKEQPAEVEQHAQQICETARETTRSLDEIVWAVNPSNDTLEGLANYACKYAQDYFALANISYRAELPPNLPPTPILPEVRHNIFLAFKEAVNNVVKHSQATEARVRLQLEADKFVLSIADNGRGVGDLSAKQLRNGLKNMRRRLADVRGEFDIAPAEGGGTVVTLTVPLLNN